MDGGICSKHLYAWQKLPIWVDYHVPGLISSPAHCLLIGQGTSTPGHSWSTHLGCALMLGCLHARARLPCAKGLSPILERASAAAGEIKAAISTEKLNQG